MDLFSFGLLFVGLQLEHAFLQYVRILFLQTPINTIIGVVSWPFGILRPREYVIGRGPVELGSNGWLYGRKYWTRLAVNGTLGSLSTQKK
jgi:hypothetical protein